jgi:photosystem II stability/assembly factor-like uncharacterized protein
MTKILLNLLVLGSLAIVSFPQSERSTRTKLRSKPKPVQPRKRSPSTVGLDFRFLTPDRRGGVWITGSAWLFRGLMLNDRENQTNAITIRGVKNVSQPQFVTANDGWMIDFQSLYRTSDGGNSWQRVDIPSDLLVVCANFTDLQVGWIGATDGKIYNTIDSGRTWTKQETGLDYEFSQIFFTDRVHGWVTAFKNFPKLRQQYALLRTTDGGMNWEILSNGDAFSTHAVHSLFFISNTEGWAIERSNYGIAHTVDGGKTWAMQEAPKPSRCNSLFFINDREGWAAGDGILHTSDSGKTWNFQRTRASGDNSLEAITFIDTKRGWAIGADTALRTNDGGNTWIEIPNSWVQQIPTFETLLEEARSNH